MSEPIKLFQYNTLSALMSGLFEGSLTIGELLEEFFHCGGVKNQVETTGVQI